MQIKSHPKLKFSTSQIIGLTVALLVFSTGLTISLLTWANLSTQLNLSLHTNAQRQLQHLTVTIAPSMLVKDRVSLNIILREWGQSAELSLIQVFDTNQQLLAEIGQADDNTPELSQAITQDNIAIGSLRATLDASSIKAITTRYLMLGITASLLCALLSGLASLGLAEYFLSYVRRLNRRLEQWHPTQNALELPRTPFLPELKHLHHHLHSITQRHQQQQAVAQALAPFSHRQEHAPLDLKYHACALLFIEIQNLETLQQQLNAEQLIQLINKYYQLLVQTAKLYHGRLERYAGNGAVMLFGLNHPNPEQDAKHCLYAAQLFLGLIDQAAPEHPIEFRLAAHWGDILLAPITETKSGRYDLIGDTLHWAAHLASHSNAQQLLVSQALHQHIAQQEQFTWQQGPEVSDLFGQQQQCRWLEKLADKQHALISRQIQHISKLLTTPD